MCLCSLVRVRVPIRVGMRQGEEEGARIEQRPGAMTGKGRRDTSVVNKKGRQKAKEERVHVCGSWHGLTGQHDVENGRRARGGGAVLCECDSALLDACASIVSRRDLLSRASVSGTKRAVLFCMLCHVRVREPS